MGFAFPCAGNTCPGSVGELQAEADLWTVMCAKHFVKLDANVIQMAVITLINISHPWMT